ncbi:MAG: type II secretion system protein [Deltaproteobacteria bacterium]|nr:type II secretion system protein [Deltaproteobacteria bacterium]
MKRLAPNHRTRGVTLVDLMIAVAILGIICNLNPFFGYQRATQQALEAEGLLRVLDFEMERARACRTKTCIDALTTNTAIAASAATTRHVSDEANTWVRARVERTYRPGPDGTIEFTVRASTPSLRHPQELRALLKVES